MSFIPCSPWLVCGIQRELLAMRRRRMRSVSGLMARRQSPTIAFYALLPPTATLIERPFNDRAPDPLAKEFASPILRQSLGGSQGGGVASWHRPVRGSRCPTSAESCCGGLVRQPDNNQPDARTVTINLMKCSLSHLGCRGIPMPAGGGDPSGSFASLLHLASIRRDYPDPPPASIAHAQIPPAHRRPTRRLMANRISAHRQK